MFILLRRKQKRDFLANAKFTAGRDEYYPIPHKEKLILQLDYTNKILVIEAAHENAQRHGQLSLSMV
jgi:hypothetical protein